ncbi:guanine permease [Halolactibacillus alkaliphilus]|uniref:Guanine permease n=1 Tax=Halolactibacillus alkaliphilus TaxID=442899 RepID=A0A511X2J3_9BACI|nr:NCS2 family permease [Halolactibacillus alkaliphilus]GEN57170.1 guanine permease [Halolactibacillus alkaliphilus]GGN72804.1 guanine permease [Halolactibacillus alkaliphilus]SFO90437.1 putative MFS transporter, AGZA family, xanthine/uracil permease [Halolactibacillus alkaliphilus]
MLEKYFNLKELGTDVRTEFMAGLTTFLAMAYILFVNPDILAAAGMDKDAVYVATALAAVIGTLVMGLYAKYPIALAPGMGLNAFFAFTVVGGYGIPWETALSGVLVSGLIFIVLTLSGVREAIINAIPKTLKLAVGSGIGLFIAFIGFQNAGIIVGDPATLVALGDFTNGNTALAIFGLIVTVILITLKIGGGVFYGMVITAVVGIVVGLIDLPSAIFGSIPSVAPTFGQAFVNFGDVFTLQMLGVILTFLFVDFFDTAGTLVAVAEKAGLMKDNELPNASKALLADSVATVTGAALGTSTTTSYVESAAGVSAGGRSGLTAVFTALLFALALFFSPLLSVVTSAVTAPALIIVGVMMVSTLKDIEWDQIEVAVPAFLTIIMMPLAYSIATGIAVGFTFYPITMLARGRGKEIPGLMWALSVVFVLFLIFLS